MIFVSACDHTIAILHEPHSLKNFHFSRNTSWGKIYNGQILRMSQEESAIPRDRERFLG